MRLITVDFASQSLEALLPDWSAALDPSSSGPQLDAVEFIESVINKWALYEDKGRTVGSLEEMKRSVTHDREGEMLGVLTASADWYENGSVVGFCQFRRTWCNNVVFDFLGVHPSLLAMAPRAISGVGTALLYRLGLVAKNLNATVVWAETTDTSARFYARLFNLSPLADLLVIKAEDFLRPLASAVEMQSKVV